MYITSCQIKTLVAILAQVIFSFCMLYYPKFRAATGAPKCAATGAPTCAATGAPTCAATGAPTCAATGAPTCAATGSTLTAWST